MPPQVNKTSSLRLPPKPEHKISIDVPSESLENSVFLPDNEIQPYYIPPHRTSSGMKTRSHWIMLLVVSSGISMTGCKFLESETPPTSEPSISPTASPSPSPSSTASPSPTPTPTPTPTPSPTSSPIVASGLLLNLDASQADGAAPYSSNSGCSAASGSAATWYDLTSNHNNGTLTAFGGSCSSTHAWNGDGTVNGTNQAGPDRLTLNGTSDYVNLGASNYIENTSFTIAAWVYPTALGYWGGIMDKFQADQYVTLGLWQTPFDNFDFVTGNGTWGDAFTTTTITTGVWYYVVATWDGTTKSIYLNGNLENSVVPDASEAPCTGAGDLWVGARNYGGAFYDGSIAAVQIYTRALSPSEISQNCNAYVSRFPGATCS